MLRFFLRNIQSPQFNRTIQSTSESRKMTGQAVSKSHGPGQEVFKVSQAGSGRVTLTRLDSNQPDPQGLTGPVNSPEIWPDFGESFALILKKQSKLSKDRDTSDSEVKTVNIGLFQGALEEGIPLLC